MSKKNKEVLPSEIAAGGRIVFKVKSEAPIEDPNEIRYIFGGDYWIEVYFEEKQMEHKTASLAYMLRRLDTDKFIQINKQIIIKLCCVKTFQKHGKTGTVKLFGGDEFTVSELFLISFANRYNEMKQQRGF